MPCGNLRMRTDRFIFKGRFKNGYLTIFFNTLPGVMISCCPPLVFFFLLLLFVERNLTKVGCNRLEIKSLSFVEQLELMEQLRAAEERRPPPSWLYALTNYPVKLLVLIVSSVCQLTMKCIGKKGQKGDGVTVTQY